MHRLIILVVMFTAVISVGCEKKTPRQNSGNNDPGSVQTPVPAEVEIPLEEKYVAVAPKGEKKLYAESFLWEKAPEFVVEKWLGEEPQTEGKYLLIEFWATWCGPCRKTVPELNEFHEKYGDKLVVIGVSDEKEDVVQKYADENIHYYAAIDTQARMKKQLKVQGIPHAIVVEPGGSVVWQGFPLLGGHELTTDVIGKILAVGETSEAK
ncbi:MAG: TlpA family protein disulfide reductase [Anaerohalosphaera sp.]|nr:TlpA family protein disulfide reductase [Anaerohalosphaera sp.]